MSNNDSSESFMLHVLKKSFPEELGNLTQDDRQQKPDYQDQTRSIGVEATIAQFGDNRMIQAQAMFNRFEGTTPTPKVDGKLKELGICPIYDNGVLVDAGEVFWVGASYPAAEAAIANKLAKLNKGNYDAMRDIRLVVKDTRDVRLPDLLADTIRQAFSSFSTEGSGVRRFTHVYVIPDMQHCVYDYDSEADTINVVPFVY